MLVLVIMASLSGKHGLACFCIWTFYSVSSVAVAADADAHAWSPEANAATLFIASASIASALVITLRRSVSIWIAGLPNDDTAFARFTPAMAVFIADHANALNVAFR
jgi:hypothetical protein